MSIDLSPRYRPFEASRELCGEIRNFWNIPVCSWRATADKVASLVILTLFIPVFAVLDLVKYVYRLVCCNLGSERVVLRPRPGRITSIPEPEVRTDNISVPAVRIDDTPMMPIVARDHQANGVPDQSLIEEVTKQFYNRPPSLSQSVEEAFRFLDQETRQAYKRLIINDGVPDDDVPNREANDAGPHASVEIFQWTANCSRAQFWKYSDNGDADCLSQRERATVLLKIMVPEIDWQLTPMAKEWVTRIQREGLILHRKQDFLMEYRVIKLAIEHSEQAR